MFIEWTAGSSHKGFSLFEYTWMFSKATLKQRLFKRVFADHIESAFSSIHVSVKKAQK